MKFILILLSLICFTNNIFCQNVTEEKFDEIKFLSNFNCFNSNQDIPPDLGKRFDAAVARQPQNPELLISRAGCYKKFENYPLFLKDFVSILRLLPKFESNYDIYNNRLITLISSSPFSSEVGIEWANHLIEKIPEHFFPYIVRAHFKNNINDYKGGYEDYLKAVELDASAVTYQTGFLLTSLIILMDHPNAIIYYTRIIELYDENIKKWVSEIEKNPPNNARLFNLNNWIKSLGKYAHEFSLILADLYLKKGDTEMSNSILNKMVTIEPRIYAFEARSKYYESKELAEKAKADRRQSIELRIEQITNEIELRKSQSAPISPKLFIDRGDLFVEIMEYEKAIADYVTFRTIVPTAAEFIDEKIAIANQKLGKQ